MGFYQNRPGHVLMKPMTLMPFRCGPLTLVFDPSNAFVRYVRCGQVEVVRGIYAAVRDHNWNTVHPEVSNLQIDRWQDHFTIEFDVACRQRDIDFTWHGQVIGEADGTLVYEMDGAANSTFLRNRLGFCLLHPPQPCQGRPCRIEHDDGSIEDSQFPDHISPHQPFKRIRAMRHSVSDDVSVEVRFAGEVFETEDQRNWTDDSYKTYCTPLELPFPVEVPTGTRVRQSMTLTLHGPARRMEPAPLCSPFAAADLVTAEVRWSERVPLPAIGLGLASHGQPPDARHIELLQQMRPAHLRMDVDLAGSDWRDRLSRAAEEAARIGAPLELAAFVLPGGEAMLQELAHHVQHSGVAIARWLLFQTNHRAVDAAVLQRARELLAFANAPIGSGTDVYFTELNRQRPDMAAMDVVAYSVNPQVHAFDDPSLIETLATQAQTVSSARHLAGDRPIAVTPVTLRPRFNPNATGPEPAPLPGELPSQVDTRQPTLFAAGWTLGSVKYLAQAGAASVTYYETTGRRGVMDWLTGVADHQRTPRDVDHAGAFPVYHVLKFIQQFVGGWAASSRSDHRLAVEVFALGRDRRRAVMLANFADGPQRVRVAGVPVGDGQLHVLDDAARPPAVKPQRFSDDSQFFTLTLPTGSVAWLCWEEVQA